MDTPSISQLQETRNYDAFFDAMMDRMYRSEDYVTHPSGWSFMAHHNAHRIVVAASPPGYSRTAACRLVEGLAAKRVIELLQSPPQPPNQDPLVTIVYGVARKRLRPEKAIEQINEIVQQAIRGALIETLPELAFQADDENGERK